MFGAALGFLGGNLVVQQSAELPSLLWGLGLLPAALLAWRYSRALPLVFFLAGLCWTTLCAEWQLDQSLAPSLEGVDLEVVGRVTDIPRTTERGVRFEFLVDTARHDGRAVAVPRRIVLSTFDHALTPRAGQRWRLTVRLKRPHGFQNPGGFDYEAHLFAQGIRAVGYVRGFPLAERAEDDGAARGGLDRFREDLSRQIATLLAGNPFTGILTAFANGDESRIDTLQWDVLRRTGTIHLIAISGMNIGLVAGIAFLLLRRLWPDTGRLALRWPAPRVAALGALASGAGYAALAGFAIPTQRALVMLAAALAGNLCLRQVAPARLLALALLAVLGYDPMATLAAGFWLSFLAVALILFALSGRPMGHGWRAYLRALGHTQWAVGIGLAPILILLFQQISLLAAPANLLAVPVIELLVIPLTLLAVLALGLGIDTLAGALLAAAAAVVLPLWSALEWLAEYSGSLWSRPWPPAWVLCCAAIGVGLLLAPRGWPGRWVGIVWCLPLLGRPAPQPAHGEFWLTQLDVGQGLAVVVRTAGHTLVYDTGARFSERFDAGRAVLVPFLRYHGIAHIDRLVLSHGDQDHVGGADALRAEIPVGQLWGHAQPQWPSAQPCAAPGVWVWDGVEFHWLHPPRDESWRGNDGSCVLSVRAAGGRALLTGDIGRHAESRLLRADREALAADVLLAPHHGSRSSSHAEFIAAVDPAWVLFSAGYRNRYRHPHPTVVQRYADRGAQSLESARHGAVTLRVETHGLSVETYRERYRRYWHTRP